MDVVDFEKWRVEILTLIADLIIERNVIDNLIIIKESIKDLNHLIDNIDSSNFHERILCVEMCFQYYKLKDNYMKI